MDLFQRTKKLKAMLVKAGVLIPLKKYDNCFLARTDPRDVARTESRTFLCSETRLESIPCVKGDKPGNLEMWPGQRAGHSCVLRHGWSPYPVSREINRANS